VRRSADDSEMDLELGFGMLHLSIAIKYVALIRCIAAAGSSRFGRGVNSDGNATGRTDDLALCRLMRYSTVAGSWRY